MSVEDPCESPSSTRPSRSRPRASDNVYIEITRPVYQRRRGVGAMPDTAASAATARQMAGEALVLAWAQGLLSSRRPVRSDEVSTVCALARVTKREACRLISSRIGARLEPVARASTTYHIVPSEDTQQSVAAALPGGGVAGSASALLRCLAEYMRGLDAIEEGRAGAPGSKDVEIGLDDMAIDSGSISSRISGDSISDDSIDIGNAMGSGRKKRRRGNNGTRTSAGRISPDGLVLGEDTRREDYSAALATIARVDFESAAVKRMGGLPAHCAVGKRAGPQKQGTHEYTMDGIPQPVDPGRWLERVKAVYSGPNVRIANRIQNCTCMRELAMGLFMCTGCMRRKAEDICRFRWVRLLTELTISPPGAPKRTRFLLAPMLASSSDAGPLPVSIATLGISRDELRTCTPKTWGEFYMIYTAAAGLVRQLTYELRAAASADPDPTQDVEYGPHPALGCSAAPLVLRRAAAGSRQLCDVCAASVLCAYYACCMCAAEVCVHCFAEWDDSAAGRRARPLTAKAASPPPRILRCKRIGQCGRANSYFAIHRRVQFVRVSTVSPNDIRRAAAKARSVLVLGAMLGGPGAFDCGGINEGPASAPRSVQAASGDPHNAKLHAWERPVAYVMPGELTTREFSRLWKDGVVVVVRGLLPALNKELWQPQWWISNVGRLPVSVWDCSSGKAMGEAWPLRDFFRLFDGDDRHARLFGAPPPGEDNHLFGAPPPGEDNHLFGAPPPGEDSMEGQSDSSDAPQRKAPPNAEGNAMSESDSKDAKPAVVDKWRQHENEVKQRILKLKDWPTADDFATVLPKQFAQLMSALPFPQYTHRDGRFNMAARLPSEHVPPDLGPKMYCAYASSEDAGGVGTTNLHCDAADAVNIMAHCGPLAEGAPAAAVWDIYPSEAAGAIREFIGAPPKGGDAIHNQTTYLTLPDRRRLHEQFGVSGYRVLQNPGDAVFVPAGCAHQVCNYANAVKVAMDFVSPERISHCQRLAAEFRALPNAHPRKADLLQLNSLLWWALADGSMQHAD
ncbi:hypothetical protein GGI23_001284 [Coemansia sp. RSA 2559]|nr:hypothetical protein GGI23_001284 [Coemansia sp. RSA 2559]KAJ2867423.1 hypothetical protein GGI22_001058 [Coemansia erecta]